MSLNGLILCHNPDLFVFDLPQNVNWVYASPLTVSTRYDYVANLNCYNEIVEDFLNDPRNYLKPTGTYIHKRGVLEALDILGISIKSYLNLPKEISQQIKEHFTYLTGQLGFSRWHIPPANGKLSFDVYFYHPIQSSSLKLYKEPLPLIETFPLQRLPPDLINEILTHADLPTIAKLCRSNKRLAQLCQTDQFKNLIKNSRPRQ